MGVFSGSRPTFVYGLAVCIYHGCVCLCANDDVGMVCSILSSRLPYNHIVVFEVVRSFILLMSINFAESTLY